MKEDVEFLSRDVKDLKNNFKKKDFLGLELGKLFAV